MDKLRNRNIFKSALKTLLKKANTVLDKSVFECFKNIDDEDKKAFIIENCRLAKESNRPLCQDTGQVMIFLKLPFGFSFGFDFKKVINDAVDEVYTEEFYRKSVVQNALFDRTNTKTNTPAIIYTDFEDRKSVKIDVLIKGGGAENMSFIEMFNPTSSEDEIISVLSQKISERALNACPPLFIGIGIGGTMDYAAILSKKALFEGKENEFCKKAKNETNKLSPEGKKDVLSVKMLSSSTHIASLPVAITINCHSNRHACCEISGDEVVYNYEAYEIPKADMDFSGYKKLILPYNNEIQQGDKILFTGTLYTMRDAAHKRICKMIENGEQLPFEIKNSIIFYAGPAPKKDGEITGPIGPTTSKRMDKYAPKLYDLGCFATIGKGNRSKEVIEACQRNNAHYFTAQGGIACLLKKCFKKAELIAFEDLGTEAIYKLEAENLPLFVKI